MRFHISFHNDHFGSLRVGPPIPLVNAKAIYLETSGSFRYRATVLDKVRIVLETVFFHWFVPGSLRRIEDDAASNGEE
jgi:hypothetical protein